MKLNRDFAVALEAAWGEPFIAVRRTYWIPPKRKRARVKSLRFEETTIAAEFKRSYFAPNALFYRLAEQRGLKPAALSGGKAIVVPLTYPEGR